MDGGYRARRTASRDTAPRGPGKHSPPDGRAALREWTTPPASPGRGAPGLAQRPWAAVSGEQALWYTLVVPISDEVRREGRQEAVAVARTDHKRAHSRCGGVADVSARALSKRLAGRTAPYPMRVGVRGGTRAKVLRLDSTSRMRRLLPTRSRIPAFAQGSRRPDTIRERCQDNGIENIVSIGFLAEVMQRIGRPYAGILTHRILSETDSENSGRTLLELPQHREFLVGQAPG